MAKIAGLSGNEIYCMHLRGYEPGEFVLGNSVVSRGAWGSLISGTQNFFGGEIEPLSKAIEEGRERAFNRMVKEAQDHGAVGVAGVSGVLTAEHGHSEFMFTGTGLHKETGSANSFFSSAGDAQELFCHMDAGYAPCSHVFGNIAYSIGAPGGFVAGFKTLKRGEIREYSDVFNQTRHAALNRITAQAKRAGANAVVGIRTHIGYWGSAHEMLMTGTAANNPILPKRGGQIVTSDLTGEELWGITAMGYAPIKMLLSTSVYSLGIKGALTSAFRSLGAGEIPELTTLVHDAREIAVDRMKQEADELGADMVVGVKTHVHHWDGLMEFMSVGTAVTKVDGARNVSPTLPPQAIIRDRDTWVGGGFGFDLGG